MNNEKKSLFVMPDGKNLMFTFILVSSLFLLWGICNGMIDVMDKHFQDELNLSKSQSAWVQFAHYLGYFLMAIPAGWLATRLGYKGGIIVGLLMVAVGGFWFLPATWINGMAHAGSLSPVTAFIAYLTGVCVIAAGLTFLETIANPYTTVLGPQRYAATRINLAQSCNGVGWICGPIIGGLFFYGKDAAGNSTGNETLYIPYVVIAFVVILLATVFYFAYIPDVRAEDDYHLDDSDSSVKISHSIWTHPHFVLAVAAQFLYVAAQAGIFSFFINYMTLEVPAIPASASSSVTSLAASSPGFLKGWLSGWFETRTILGADDLKDAASLVVRLKQKADPVSSYLSGKLSKETVAALAGYKDSASSDLRSLQSAVLQDLNDLVKKQALYDPADPQRFAGVQFSEPTRQFVRMMELDGKTVQGNDRNRFNRMLLADAYPKEIPFTDGVLCISDSLAANLASLGFICFLIGRFTGAGLLKKYSAHKILALYALLNVAMCALIFCKFGWLSMACLFLSYFFMSIMFPTIFALGIFGLGARAKKASSYIVMAIMGGAVLPKLMGYVADQYDMSRSFVVPGLCFAFVALYGFLWPKLAHAESLHGAAASGGH